MEEITTRIRVGISPEVLYQFMQEFYAYPPAYVADIISRNRSSGHDLLELAKTFE